MLAAAAQAQQYQRLHVRSFTLSSDEAAPQIEQPFHVTLTIQIAENLVQVRNVFLPTFFGAEELGDVQETAHSSRGTTYRETLTLVAHQRGTLSVSPAYLDAIDARDGKPKRFISNGLQLAVGGGPISGVWDVLRKIAIVAIDLLLIAAVIFVVAAIFWRRRTAPRAPALASAPMPEPEVAVDPAPKDEAAEAFERLRERRDRASVLALRAVLWNAAGALDGETLNDVLRRPAARGEAMRRLLTSVERAAFIDDERLDSAIEEVLCNPR
jgi:hypothetical protein